MTSDNSLAAEIIEKAVELIDNRGWIKGMFETKDGFCMLGGINHVVRDVSELYDASKLYNDYYHAYFRALKAIEDLIPESYDIPDFNDHPDRTWSECRELMMSAAAVLRSQ